MVKEGALKRTDLKRTDAAVGDWVDGCGNGGGADGWETVLYGYLRAYKGISDSKSAICRTCLSAPGNVQGGG